MAARFTVRLSLVAVALLSGANAFAPGPTMPLGSRAGLRSSLKMMAETEGPPKANLGLAGPFLEGNREAEGLFRFLQRTDYIQEREGFLMGEVFADRCIRESGFTDFAEKVNGRIAQIMFPIALSNTFNGDILNQIADHPIKALFISVAIAAASLPPLFDADEKDRRGISLIKTIVPPSLADGMMGVYNTFELNKIFTPEAERTNSRVAMAAFGFWIATAVMF